MLLLCHKAENKKLSHTVDSDIGVSSDDGSPALKKKRKLQDSDGKSDAHVAASDSDGDAAQSGTKSTRGIRPAVAESSAKAVQASCHTHAQTCSFVTRSC